MQALSFCSCVAVIVAALALQTLHDNASITRTVTAILCCRCVAVVVPALATQASLCHCCRHPAVFVSACGMTVPTKTTAMTEVAVTPISAAGREGTTPPHSTEEQKQKQKQCHHHCSRCLRPDDDAAMQSSSRRQQCKSLSIALLLLLSGCLCFHLREAQSTTNHCARRRRILRHG
jgi:hypothetical protein